MKNAETLFLAIPGVAAAEVSVRIEVSCRLPMTQELVDALLAGEKQIGRETGLRTEMSISAGKKYGDSNSPLLTDDELRAEMAAWEQASTWACFVRFRDAVINMRTAIAEHILGSLIAPMTRLECLAGICIVALLAGIFVFALRSGK